MPRNTATKDDIMNLDEIELVNRFREFVVTKQGDTPYDYQDTRACAFAQFLKSQGERDPFVRGNSYVTPAGSWPIPLVLQPVLGSFSTKYEDLYSWEDLLEKLDEAVK
jgi:hypothetical protein